MSDKFEEIKQKAKNAKDKKPALGTDISTGEFCLDDSEDLHFKDLKNVPQDLSKTLINVGLDVKEQNRAGTYIQEGNRVGFCKTIDTEKVEILPVAEALEKYDWVKDYYWKAVAVDTDKYTAETELNTNLQGYFIHAKEGAKDIFPLQSCLFINVEGLKQVVHNIIIAEKNSQLNIITGCTVHPNIRKALHLGTSEFYLKEGSQVTFTMVHYWGDKTAVRPRTGVIQEANTSYISNYIIMSEVQDLQANPISYLNGDNAKFYSQTLVYGKGKSKIDLGARAVLNGKNTHATLISKIIGDDEADIMARGEITGKGTGSGGHIDCSGLLISPKARIDSIPRIAALTPDTSLTHEASLGKIGEDQIQYLKSRGLNENEARDLIISGFLEADYSHLPPELAQETRKLIELASKAKG